MVRVAKKFWEIKEFWYEFLDISHIGLTGRLPGIRDTVKQSIRKIKMTTLERWDTTWVQK